MLRYHSIIRARITFESSVPTYTPDHDIRDRWSIKHSRQTCDQILYVYMTIWYIYIHIYIYVTFCSYVKFPKLGRPPNYCKFFIGLKCLHSRTSPGDFKKVFRWWGAPLSLALQTLRQYGRLYESLETWVLHWISDVGTNWMQRVLIAQ